MSIHSGCSYPEDLSVLVDVLLEAKNHPLKGYGSSYYEEDLLCGTVSLKGSPGEHPKTVSGCKEPDFVSDFYGRIHVRPAVLSLGLVLSAKTEVVEVWNAYFTSNTLHTIEATNASNLSVDGPAVPVVLDGLSSATYEINASLSGAPTINAQFRFWFSSGSGSLSVLGQRVKAFPHPVDWSQSVLERLEWKTQVLESFNRSEQRVQLRENPRRIYETSNVGFYQDRVYMEALIATSLGIGFGVPVWTDQTNLTQKAFASSSRIYVDTTFKQFSVGGYVFLFASPSVYGVFEIADIDIDWIDLVQPLVSTWPKGSLACPLVVAYADNNTQISHITGQVGIGSIRFSQTYAVLQPGASVPFFPQYNGYPVLEKMANWRNARDTQFNRKLYAVDNGVNTPRVIDFSGKGTIVRSFEWFLNGREAISEFRSWAAYTAGRLNPFWLPTGDQDFVQAQDYLAGGPSFFVKGNLVSSYYLGGDNKLHLRIELKNGKVFYTRILSGQADSGDPNNDLLSISPALDTSFNVSSTKLISLMSLCRNEADAIDINWFTPSTAIVSQRMLVLSEQPE